MIDNGSHLDVLRVLVLLQGAIATTSAIEVTVVGLATGAVWVALLTWAGAVATWLVYRRLPHRSPRARTILRRLQYGWLALGTIDLLLALVLARRGLEPVALLVRFVLPVGILRMLKATSPIAAPAEEVAV